MNPTGRSEGLLSMFGTFFLASRW
ncbi:rCG30374 [Rattus norvegicus]|uniref:RCG30374 n=1 Tax=Rattus norvegicus TaxID=10116 RepID=A6JF90_RAT|nr:rCG30374 [Rattus norvegicus]